MKKLKAHMPLFLLGLSFLAFYMGATNSQIFYGGYKGLLFHSLNDVASAEGLDIRGELLMSPLGDHLGDLMEMTFVAEGQMDLSKRTSNINIALVGGLELDQVPLARVVQEGDRLSLIPEGLSGETIDLTSMMVDASVAETLDGAYWESLYPSLLITEVRDKDPRRGKGYLEGSFTSYQLDLMAMLTQEQKQRIEEVLGEGVLKEGMVIADFQIDTKGDLAAIRLHCDTSAFTAEGWLTLEAASSEGL